MKRIAYLLIVVLLLASCLPSVESLMPILTAAPPLTSTVTHVPASTKSPTSTPIVPTATIRPIVAVPVSTGPLTLTEFNAGTEMKRLNVIGTGTAHDINFSPDGKRLAVATGRGVYLYDGTNFEMSGFIDLNDSVSAVAFSPDGNVLAVAVDGKASLWNVFSGQIILNLEGELVSIYKLVYGRGGYVAAIGGTCRGCGTSVEAVILWDTETGRQIFIERDIWHSTIALSFTHDGEQLVFGAGGISVIETQTGKRIAAYNTGKPIISAAIDAPFDLVSNKEGDQLFITSFEGASEIFDVATQTRRPFVLCHAYLISNDSYGACPENHQMVIFDLMSGEEVKSIDVDIDVGTWNGMFVLSPDSRYLAYGRGSDVFIIDIQTEQLMKKLEFTSFDVAMAGLINIAGVEKYVIAVENPPGQISLFELQSGINLRTLRLDCCEIMGFTFAPDRKTAATISGNILHIWDLSSQQVIYEEDLEQDYSGSIFFSPDGSKVYLTHNPEDYVLELNLQTKERKNLGRNSYVYNYVDSFAVDNYHFNRLGNFVVLEYERINEEYNPSFRDVVTNEKIVLSYNAVADPLFLETFAMSGGGKYLVIGNATGIYVWDADTQKQLLHLDKHGFRGGDGWIGAIKSLMFNPQSNLLVSVGWDETTRLWSIITGNELRTLNVCCSASFTPDGRYLITAGDGVMRVWGIP